MGIIAFIILGLLAGAAVEAVPALPGSTSGFSPVTRKRARKSSRPSRLRCWIGTAKW